MGQEIKTLFESSGFNQLVRAKDGFFLCNRNDYYISGALLKYGEYSGLEMALFRRILVPGSVIMEVGANLGAHTVGLARIAGNGGRVIAFEPQRLIFQTLCANIALNNLENVECHWAAVGEQAGAVAVPEMSPHEKTNFGGVSLIGATNGDLVLSRTLDSFVDLPRLNFVKIDVEGMEKEVILGALNLLQRFKPIIYVENDRIDKSRELIELIASIGYRLFWHLPPLYNPANFRGDSENLYGNTVSCNMLCLHRDDMRVRVEGIPEIIDSSSHPVKPYSVAGHSRQGCVGGVQVSLFAHDTKVNAKSITEFVTCWR
jgi:FkbM family methyltransferase